MLKNLYQYLFVYQEAYKENVKEREAAEKAKRAKEAREKAEKERQERISRKRLIDMNPEQTQEGVMDRYISFNKITCSSLIYQL